jgi:hypothetical protein
MAKNADVLVMDGGLMVLKKVRPSYKHAMEVDRRRMMAQAV